MFLWALFGGIGDTSGQVVHFTAGSGCTWLAAHSAVKQLALLQFPSHAVLP
jgi:hypothetical protein